MDQSITNQLIIMESLCGRGLFLERGEGPVGEKEGEGLSTSFFIYFFVVSLVSKSFLGFGFLVLTSLKCCFGGSRFFFDFFFHCLIMSRSFF